jgi:L-aspartate oxidase
LQQQMWQHAGLLRDRELLKSIDLTAAALYADAVPSAQWTRREYEARSLARVARAIVVCALAREESRGAHYRNDFPQRDDVRFGTHSHLVGDSVSFGPLLPGQVLSEAQPESPALR